jgi:hypothetical protein
MRRPITMREGTRFKVGDHFEVVVQFANYSVYKLINRGKIGEGGTVTVFLLVDNKGMIDSVSEQFGRLTD